MAAKKSAKKGKAAKRSASKKPAKRPAARKTATKARKGAAKKGGRKAAKRPAARKAAPKKAAKKAAPKKKRAPNPAFMKPMQPSGQLAAVIGDKPMPRSEVTKKVWAYIKNKGLQDNKNRRMINADDKLGPVFGGKKQVSMFEMTKLVNKHLKG
ncbi:MAG: SWIB/MDM2 domain-containing protein [Gemmatimonadota bacterium]